MRYIVSIIGLLLVSLSHSVFGLPEVIQDMSITPISLQRKEPVFVYFSYGDLASQESYSQSFLQVSLSSASLHFDPINIFEIVRSGKNDVSCDKNTQGETFPIDSSLIKDQGLLYGPRSAKVPLKGSGEQFSVLEPKQTGCLKLGVKIGAGATQGEKVLVRMEQGYLDKQGRAVLFSQRPVKIVQLHLGETPQCTGGLVAYGVQCVPACRPDQYRSQNGECVSSALQCPIGQEVVKGICKDVCQKDTVRDNFGECKKNVQNYTEIVSRVVTYILIGTVIIVIILMLLHIIRSFTKLKKV